MTPTIDTPTAMDLVVLTLPDTVIVGLIERNLKLCLELRDRKHRDVASHLIKALDNMYGEHSYAAYLSTGVLPSHQ